MKIKLLFTAFVAFIATAANAQDWSSDVYRIGEEYPGYVITETGEKIEGFIRYSDPYSMQTDVLFFGEKGNRKSKVKYKTADLKEYKVADKLYHCIHYSGGLLKKPVRANLVVKEGCITEYVWYDNAEGYALMTRGSNESIEDYYARRYTSTVVYKKGLGDIRPMTSFGLKFADKMSDFVSENKELARKVANKEKGYGMISIQAIIDEYNANCEE